MKLRSIALALVSVALLGSVPAAADYDGYELLLMCSAPGKTPFMISHGICLGYVAAASAILQEGTAEGHRACIPEMISTDQKSDVVKRWLAFHPRQRGRAANEVVLLALAEAYPCD